MKCYNRVSGFFDASIHGNYCVQLDISVYSNIVFFNSGDKNDLYE